MPRGDARRAFELPRTSRPAVGTIGFVTVLRDRDCSLAFPFEARRPPSRSLTFIPSRTDSPDCESGAFASASSGAINGTGRRDLRRSAYAGQHSGGASRCPTARDRATRRPAPARTEWRQRTAGPPPTRARRRTPDPAVAEFHQFEQRAERPLLQACARVDAAHVINHERQGESRAGGQTSSTISAASRCTTRCQPSG